MVLLAGSTGLSESPSLARAEDRFVSDSTASAVPALDSLPALADLVPRTADGFATPERLALDALGHLFVLDRGRGRIYRASDDGPWLEFGSGEQGGARLPQVSDLFARPGPDLYALDGNAGVLYRFDLEGRLRASIDWRAAGPEMGVAPPSDFAMTGSGELLLLDREGGRLWWIDRRGRLVTDLAGGLGGSARPRAPTGLGLDAAGTIYLLDPPGARILRFTRQGDALPPWSYGAGLGAEAEQALLAVRSDGSVLLASRQGSWLRWYECDGRLRREWRGPQRKHAWSDAAAADTVLYLACPGEGSIQRRRLPGSEDGGPGGP